MDVRLIDRARNFTRVPTKGPPFKPPLADVLDALLAGQLEFECDDEFAEALDAEKKAAKPDAPIVGDLADEPEIETIHGRRSRSFRNVPIVVVTPPEATANIPLKTRAPEPTQPEG